MQEKSQKWGFSSACSVVHSNEFMHRAEYFHHTRKPRWQGQGATGHPQRAGGWTAPADKLLLCARPPHRSVRSWQVDGCTQG